MVNIDPEEHLIQISAGGVLLEGLLTLPPGPRGIVLFAHGSGSSRHSPRNRFVAGVLNQAGLATLLIDLLTPHEEYIDVQTAGVRFDIELLADRLVEVTDWLASEPATRTLHIGYFGASTGAAAALVAAARRTDVIGAVVSRGGRPDLARGVLEQVRAPTLLIVGGADRLVLTLNRTAYDELEAPKRLEIVPGATHLFEEPGALARVAELARDWFLEYLTSGLQPGFNEQAPGPW
ncbi:MAG TPA: dienelactone hydrolase family protein [Polyangia bacterium]|jgi:dienelactone hydrolase|nr:dienelactone hydrolase family protein [Polyangia bacterium]